jgi:hypothetical protein
MTWKEVTCEGCQVQYSEDSLNENAELEFNGTDEVLAHIYCPNCGETFTSTFKYYGYKN